jgi:hypothetical protein
MTTTSSARQGLVATEVRKHGVAAPHGQREAHAGSRPGARHLRSGKIGVGIHIGETHRQASAAPEAEQAPQNDAAIAAQDEHECAVAGRDGDAPGERTAVVRYVILVPGASRRSHQVPVGRWDDVAVVAGAEALD